MKLAVFGAGYVGLVTAAGLADLGNQVWLVETDPPRRSEIAAGRPPFHEPGLAELLRRMLDTGRLHVVEGACPLPEDLPLALLAVGTPALDDGSADLRQVMQAADDLARHVQRDLVVAVRSTVPVGTCDRLRRQMGAVLQSRGLSLDIAVASMPEFLKEGSALRDFQRPDRIVIGCAHAAAAAVLQELVAPLTRARQAVVMMDVRSAELTKYAANAMLATRISFMNEMAALAEATGADLEQVRRGIGADPRIGPYFLYAGAGFGGACFPKDLRALQAMARAAGVPARIAQAAESANLEARQRLIDQVLAHARDAGGGACIAVWGLAFKPDTDDVREAPALDLVQALALAGVSVRAYDPQAMATARTAMQSRLPAPALARIHWCHDALTAAQGADALCLMTEWKEFRSPDFAALATRLRRKVIFDGRNQYDPQRLRALGFVHRGVGRGHPRA